MKINFSQYKMIVSIKIDTMNQADKMEEKSIE